MLEIRWICSDRTLEGMGCTRGGGEAGNRLLERPLQGRAPAQSARRRAARFEACPYGLPRLTSLTRASECVRSKWHCGMTSTL